MVSFIAFAPTVSHLNGNTFCDADFALKSIARQEKLTGLKLAKGQVFTKDGTIVGAFVDPSHFRDLESLKR
jgi:hypothetical protein